MSRFDLTLSSLAPVHPAIGAAGLIRGILVAATAHAETRRQKHLIDAALTQIDGVCSRAVIDAKATTAIFDVVLGILEQSRCPLEQDKLVGLCEELLIQERDNLAKHIGSLTSAQGRLKDF